MNLAEVSSAISAALEADFYIEGWTHYDSLNDTFQVPGSFVLNPTRLEDDVDFDGMIRLRLAVRYAVPRANELQARSDVSQAIQAGKRALSRHPNLGGVVDSVRFVGVGNFSNFRTVTGEMYYGAEQELEILAR